MDKRFADLVVQCAGETEPAARRQVEEMLWAEFGATTSLLVMDLSTSGLSLEAVVIKR